MLLCAGCVHGIHDATGLAIATIKKVAGGGRKIACYNFVHQRSFMYQHELKSGWLLILPLVFLVHVGFLEVLEASDPSLPVNCLPVRLAVIQHVDFDVLLKTMPKKLCSSSGRRSASSWELRPPAARTTLFFTREKEALAAAGKNDRECTRTEMYFLFLLRVSLHFGLTKYYE